MILNKSDLIEYTKLIGENMPEQQVAPFIQDAETFDIIPVLPEEMFEDIMESLPSPVIAWNRNESYTIGDIIFHNNKFWMADANNSDSEPTTSNTDWVKHELLTLWQDYIRPLYAYYSISRWIVEHGRNGTQFGLTKQVADTFENWSDKERAEIKSSYDSKANHYVSLLRKELANKSYTYDGKEYEYTCGDEKPKVKFKLWQGSTSKNNDPWQLH